MLILIEHNICIYSIRIHKEPPGAMDVCLFHLFCGEWDFMKSRNDFYSIHRIALQKFAVLCMA